jgi:site-specific DNA recombinase
MRTKRQSEEQELEPKQPVIAMIRVSSPDQATDDKAGIDAQKFACEGIARKHNLEIRWTIQIDGVSGASVRRSPGMQNLLRIAASGQCHGIVLKEESRLMRPEAFGDYSVLEILENSNVKLYLVDSVTDFSKPSEKLFSHIKFAFAGYERMIIRDRLLGGKRAKQRRGEWATGENSVPFGMKIVTENKRHYLRVDDAKIGKVRRIFERFCQGCMSFMELGREAGISNNAVGYILSNEIYIGYHSSRKTVRVIFDDVMKPRADGGYELHGNVYRKNGTLRYQKRRLIAENQRKRVKLLDNPPISEELFMQAQRLLHLRTEMRVKRAANTPDPFLYRGLLRCAHCGGRLLTLSYSNTDARKSTRYEVRYYVCQTHRDRPITPNGVCPTRRIRQDALEPILDRIIMDRFANADFIQSIMEAQVADEASGNRELDLKRLNAEIVEADRCIERNHDLYVRGRITQEVCDRNDDRLQLERRALLAALEKITPAFQTVTPEMWAPIARQFCRWLKLDLDERRALLASIAPVFVVSG